jgi:hypothetical protein
MTNKNRENIIKVYQTHILKLEKEQDKLFRNACKDLKIQSSSPKSDILFDVLYNNTHTPKQTVEHIWGGKDVGV